MKIIMNVIMKQNGLDVYVKYLKIKSQFSLLLTNIFSRGNWFSILISLLLMSYYNMRLQKK